MQTTTKKALVTGASEGLGRTFVKALARQGYQTTSVARNEKRLQDLVAELPEGHDYIVADLGTDEGVKRCAASMQDGSYSLLINNAGYSRFGDFCEADVNDELTIMRVNCQAVMQLSHVFLQTATYGDALINLSSLTFTLPTPVQPTYVATKCFIASFSESLWYQQRPHGVYVQGLCPGVTKTQFIDRAGDVSKKFILDLVSQSPEKVVEASLAALEERKQPIVIPGIGNRLIAMFIRMLPRRWSVWMMGKLGDIGLA